MEKTIKKSKEIVKAEELKQRVKENVLEDLGMIWQEKWLEEKEIKSLVDTTIGLTINNLAKED
jgi:hypothetical protein